MNPAGRFSLKLVVLTAATALRLPAVEITLPVERAKLVESPLPGYGAAVAMCQTCHSAEYIAYQPSSARAYWQATVVKMQKVFGAPLPDSVVAPIVDYLVKTYGTERGQAATAVGNRPGATAGTAMGK